MGVYSRACVDVSADGCACAHSVFVYEWLRVGLCTEMTGGSPHLSTMLRINAVPLVYHKISDFESTDNLIRVLLVFIVSVHVGWGFSLLWYASREYHSSLVHCVMDESCHNTSVYAWVFVCVGVFCMYVCGLRVCIHEYGWARIFYVHEYMLMSGWRDVVCFCLRGYRRVIV